MEFALRSSKVTIFSAMIGMGQGKDGRVMSRLVVRSSDLAGGNSAAICGACSALPTWQIEMTLQAGPREAAESPPQRSSASSAMCKPVVRTQSGSLWHMHAPMLANPSHAFTTTQTNPDNRTGSALRCPTARGGVRVASQRPQRPTLCRTPRSKRRAQS